LGEICTQSNPWKNNFGAGEKEGHAQRSDRKIDKEVRRVDRNWKKQRICGADFGGSGTLFFRRRFIFVTYYSGANALRIKPGQFLRHLLAC